MTIRLHIRRDDGFGEYRNIYHVESLHDYEAVWQLDMLYKKPNSEENEIKRIVKSGIVGLPEIVG